MQAIVLAAGRGTRMGTLSDTIPKPLLPVAGESIVEHVLGAATTGGARELIVVTGYQESAVREALGEEHNGVPITYVTQPEVNGTASAVKAALEHVDGPFAVLNGDCVFTGKDLAALFEAAPSIGVYEVEDPREYGVVSMNGTYVEGIIEKPDNPPSHLANAGAYVFPDDGQVTLDVEQSERGEYEITDAVRTLVENWNVSAIELDAWMDVGYPWELLEANERILGQQPCSLDGSVHSEAELSGNVVVAETATVREGTVIEGPVRIDEHATVGPNAYIRGSTMIGAGAEVGHGAEVKNSIVMEHAKIPHISYVGDSIIGPRVNLGAGTTIANLRHDEECIKVTVKGERVSTGRTKFGAIIGANVKTGINTAINPGVTLSAGSCTYPGETVETDR